jgi:hypothetical protein
VDIAELYSSFKKYTGVTASMANLIWEVNYPDFSSYKGGLEG